MKKTNNKGFSLVELIIVIAIMAILIGVLAPQYIKYVERSRISSDKDTIDSLTKAVQTATTDDEYYDTLTSGDSIILTGTAAPSVAPNLQSPVSEFYGSLTSANKFKSKAFKNETITIKIYTSGSSSALKVSVTDGTGALYNPDSYK